MKTKSFKLMSTAMALFATMTIFTSCCNGDDPQPDPINIEDRNAGIFILSNLTTGELIENNTTSYIPKGDRLQIKFSPSEKYRKCNFKVKYSIIGQNSEVKEISDVYVSKGNDGSKIVMEANGNFTSNDTIYHLSAIQEYTFLSPSSIDYGLSVSPDLLLFVTPEICYDDDEGVKHTMQITEEMMTTKHVTNEKMGIERNYTMGTWSTNLSSALI